MLRCALAHFSAFVYHRLPFVCLYLCMLLSALFPVCRPKSLSISCFTTAAHAVNLRTSPIIAIIIALWGVL